MSDELEQLSPPLADLRRHHELLVLSEEALELAHQGLKPDGTPVALDLSFLRQILDRVEQLNRRIPGAPTP